jgi:hypothetical protein
MATDDCECADGVAFFGGPHHHLGHIDKTDAVDPPRNGPAAKRRDRRK